MKIYKGMILGGKICRLFGGVGQVVVDNILNNLRSILKIHFPENVGSICVYRREA